MTTIKKLSIPNTIPIKDLYHIITEHNHNNILTPSDTHNFIEQHNNQTEITLIHPYNTELRIKIVNDTFTNILTTTGINNPLKEKFLSEYIKNEINIDKITCFGTMHDTSNYNDKLIKQIFTKTYNTLDDMSKAIIFNSIKKLHKTNSNNSKKLINLKETILQDKTLSYDMQKNNKSHTEGFNQTLIEYQSKKKDFLEKNIEKYDKKIKKRYGVPIFIDFSKNISNCMLCITRERCNCKTLYIYLYEDFLFLQDNKTKLKTLEKTKTIRNNIWFQQYQQKYEYLLILIKKKFPDAQEINFFPWVKDLTPFFQN